MADFLRYWEISMSTNLLKKGGQGTTKALSAGSQNPGAHLVIIHGYI